MLQVRLIVKNWQAVVSPGLVVVGLFSYRTPFTSSRAALGPIFLVGRRQSADPGCVRAAPTLPLPRQMGFQGAFDPGAGSSRPA